jgi:RNA polymerase sigma factor (sigma-70 family)
VTAATPFSGEHLLRDLAPQVLGALIRRFGDFSAAEDAVQEALLAAALQWPDAGVPENPRGWLYHVAVRRLTDHWRTEHARRRREALVLTQTPADELVAPPPDAATLADYGSLNGVSFADAAGQDDTLILLFMCCHPSLTRPSAIALTLRAVGGLTTAEIAHAFLVPEATMAQRISRAKQKIKSSGVPFRMPTADDRADRLSAVLHVLYLIFNEGYASSSGQDLQRRDLASEAIRLTRAVHRLLPEDGEVAGLLALLLLTDARRHARTTADGELVPLAEQDRTLWDRAAIEEGTELVTASFTRGAVGFYQLQAAIASLHDEAASAEATDWPQILALYTVLKRMSDNPMVALNHAIAAAMVHGPAAGLALLTALDADERVATHFRLDAVRAHLHEMNGERLQAIAAYRRAAARTANVPERHYLTAKAARLAADGDPGS